MNMRQAINQRMGHSNCPTGGSLGECAAIFESDGTGDDQWWTACLYLWPAAEGLAPAEVAAWFEQLGAKHVTVSAVLHDPENNIVNAYSVDDGVRPWDVTFYMPRTLVENTALREVAR